MSVDYGMLNVEMLKCGAGCVKTGAIGGGAYIHTGAYGGQTGQTLRGEVYGRHWIG